MSDSWPGECSQCEAGRCEKCSGHTLEGFSCMCAEEGHCGMLDYEEDYDFEVVEGE